MINVSKQIRECVKIAPSVFSIYYISDDVWWEYMHGDPTRTWSLTAMILITPLELEIEQND